MAVPPEIRWGILATGSIAKIFALELLLDPTTRGVTHIKHTISAVASSSGIAQATRFLKEINAPTTAKPYGSYEDLVSDPSVDIIYVASPHSHHYQNARLCLEAGKNVLCEKPLTVNAAQAERLSALAKEKQVFFMEGVWTRFLPVSEYVRNVVMSGRLGQLQRVYADCSHALDPEKSMHDGKHRMVNPDLAGGALLGLGIYALTWIFQALVTTVPQSERRMPSVQSFTEQYGTTMGVDELTTILLSFPCGEGIVHAVATTGIRYATEPLKGVETAPACRIYGEYGELQVFAPLYRPTKTRLVLRDGTCEDQNWIYPGPGKGSGWSNGIHSEGEGQGLFWEADEAAAAIIQGRKEGRFGLDESIAVMKVMDEVRKQGGLRYPENIESLEFPLSLC